MSDFKQAVIDILIRYSRIWQGDYYKPFRMAIDEINALPSAEPDLDEHSAWFRIGETLVDESKAHISAQEACQKIREYLRRMKKPERKGHWIEHDEIKNVYGGICIECSECGEKYVVQYVDDEKYCRHCGADMRGREYEID